MNASAHSVSERLYRRRRFRNALSPTPAAYRRRFRPLS